MRRWNRLLADDGSASLEFITAGVLLLVPLVYLVVALSVLQGAAFAAEGAARQAARVFVQAHSPAAAQAAAERAVTVAFADFGIESGVEPPRYECTPNPDACLTRSGTVTVTVRASVALPLMPPFLVAGGRGGIPFEASATQTVSRFWTGTQ
jgi:hypothetical protein